MPDDHKWWQCIFRQLDEGWGKYYQIENDCNRTDTQSWKIRYILFDAYVLQTVLYGVEVWGDSISPSTWNDIDKIQKAFLCKHLGVKETTPYSILLVEMGQQPIEFHALVRVMHYIVKVQQTNDDKLPK